MTIADDGREAVELNGIRVAVYASVATAPQDGTSASLEDQLEQLRKGCRERGWTVVDEYKDIGTPGPARPGLEALLAATTEQPGVFDKIVIQNAAALSRDSMQAHRWIKIFKDAGTPIETMTTSDDDAGWMLRQLIAMYNEAAASAHSTRVKRGIADARARRGTDVVLAAEPTKIPCNQCGGRGWQRIETVKTASSPKPEGF